MSFFRLHVLAFAAFLAACSSHEGKNEVKGALQQFSQDVVTSSVQDGHFSLSLPLVDEKKLSAPVQTFALRIEIGEFKKVIQEKYEAGKLIAVEGLPAGKFKLSMQLLSAEGKVLKEGEALGEIVAGKATAIRLTLKNSQDGGKGSLTIKVEDSDKVVPTVKPEPPLPVDDCKESDFDRYMHCKLSTFAVKEGYIKDRGNLKIVSIHSKRTSACKDKPLCVASKPSDHYMVMSKIRNFKGLSGEADVLWSVTMDFTKIDIVKVDLH